MRVLLTGVSGTGKSSLVKELRRRGFTAFDADDDGYTTPLPDGTWAWRIEPIRSLFDRYGDRLVFFAGCSDEQAVFDFDYKVLLTAPVEVILDRLRLRTTNPFGKTHAERDRVVADMEWVLPLLRASADLVIETTQPTNEVADTVIRSVAPSGMASPK
jgi:shikimate kinase